MTWTKCSISDKTCQRFAGVGLVKVVTVMGNSLVLLGSWRGLGRVGSPCTAWRASVLCQQGLWPGRPYSTALELTPDCSRVFFFFCGEKWHFGAKSWNGKNTEVLEISHRIEWSLHKAQGSVCCFPAALKPWFPKPWRPFTKTWGCW